MHANFLLRPNSNCATRRFDLERLEEKSKTSLKSPESSQRRFAGGGKSMNEVAPKRYGLGNGGVQRAVAVH